MSNDPIVIVSAARTPIGSFQGVFSSMTAPQLGGVAIKAAIERAKVKPEQVQEVFMGCVLPAGLRQAPARQAALNGGLPYSAGCTTVNKVCGSGMKTVMLAHDLLALGSVDVAVAGGMESMTNAPYMLPKARSGYRLGHGQVLDHMFFDGLEDAYSPETAGRAMGTFAEDTADKYKFTRQMQDEFAATSTTRSVNAINNGAFEWEIEPVTVKTRKGDTVVKSDEEPPKTNLDKIPTMKPSFRRENGTVTPASSSSISDGAAAMVLMRQSTAQKMGLQPLAKIVGHSTHSQEPRWFTTAPVGAMNTLLQKTGWKVSDVDLWEINEAFAVVTMAAIHDMKLPADKVNVNGGACALGHPIGASGSRILVTLIGALKKSGGKRGIASLCIGGGEATAMAIEML